MARRTWDASYQDPNVLGYLWWPAILVLAPAFIFLVLVGVIYEVILRLDRSRVLSTWTLWTLSGVAAVCVTLGFGWWAFYRG